MSANDKPTILIIDDEEDIRNVLQEILERDGFNTLTAMSGFEGIDLLKQQHHVDLVLLDIKMPKMNGIETLQKIREFNQETAIIILTAYGTLQTARGAMKLGAYDYIPKPFDEKFLKILIRQGLQASKNE